MEARDTDATQRLGAGTCTKAHLSRNTSSYEDQLSFMWGQKSSTCHACGTPRDLPGFFGPRIN
jgi:hypothetical protein